MLCDVYDYSVDGKLVKPMFGGQLNFTPAGRRSTLPAHCLFTVNKTVELSKFTPLVC